MARIGEDDLVLQNQSLSSLLGDIKRSNLSIYNRLRSIREDADFVSRVAGAYGRPVVANERCGSWYTDPAVKAASAYFKSTDGHTWSWSFSSRRLNFHLLDLVEKHDGCIIVDSTRRGKRMPDALSKTIPIWCAVLNRVLFPENTPAHQLRTPPNVVSESEHLKISERLDSFVESLLSLGLDLKEACSPLGKPLRPLWVTPDTPLPLATPEVIFENFRPVVCCTSSRRAEAGELGGSVYVQGAGDDTETWACGLTADLFWRHLDALFEASEPELPELCRKLAGESEQGGASTSETVSLSPEIHIAPMGIECARDAADCYILLLSETSKPSTWTVSDRVMKVGIGKGKTGSRALRQALEEVVPFGFSYLSRAAAVEAATKRKVVIQSESGWDFSVATALAMLCYCFDQRGNLRPQEDDFGTSKPAIRARLAHVMTRAPQANPSRSSLQSVNSFLLDWRK